MSGAANAWNPIAGDVFPLALSKTAVFVGNVSYSINGKPRPNFAEFARLALSIGDPSRTTTWHGPVSYTITYFNASDVTLAPADITLDTTGNATGTVSISASGNVTRIVTISNITGDGTIAIRIGPGTASAAWGETADDEGPSAPFQVSSVTPIPVGGSAALTVLIGILGLSGVSRFRRK